jgi:hypothetical protein
MMKPTGFSRGYDPDFQKAGNIIPDGQSRNLTVLSLHFRHPLLR